MIDAAFSKIFASLRNMKPLSEIEELIKTTQIEFPAITYAVKAYHYKRNSDGKELKRDK
jgi:hypothetical protein